MTSYRKYIFVFLITFAIFATAFSVSTHLSNKKAASIKNTEDKISTDILSLETQFELLQEASCKNLKGSTLSEELDFLGEKLDYAESQKEMSSESVMVLKKYYSILQIKDYLLMKKVDQKCDTNPIVILYFYSNRADTCNDCTKQGYVLTELRKNNPGLRIYSFDYDLELSAIKTLISIYGVPHEFPALVANEKAYTGFKSIEDIEKILPELTRAKSTATASSTPLKK